MIVKPFNYTSSHRLLSRNRTDDSFVCVVFAYIDEVLCESKFATEDGLEYFCNLKYRSKPSIDSSGIPGIVIFMLHAKCYLPSI